MEQLQDITQNNTGTTAFFAEFMGNAALQNKNQTLNEQSETYDQNYL